MKCFANVSLNYAVKKVCVCVQCESLYSEILTNSVCLRLKEVGKGVPIIATFCKMARFTVYVHFVMYIRYVIRALFMLQLSK